MILRRCPGQTAGRDFTLPRLDKPTTIRCLVFRHRSRRPSVHWNSLCRSCCMLSVILSKAFMLADDDRITEPQIINQMKRGLWRLHGKPVGTSRRKTIFASQFSMLRPFKPLHENNSLFQNPKSRLCSTRPASFRRGGSRSSRTLGAGCDGRGARSDEARITYGEIVRSRSPDAGIKLCVTSARRRWPESPEHRGDHV